ncbi:MAG TPA: hypothetical protein VI542_03580 [Candidatus Tectomicrobia bacterium]|jgi:hypothetical protein
MIILDEQLLGRHIENDIAKWYRGTVRFIVEVRPHTVIKDEMIPAVLRQANQPTFVTINDQDFWRKVAIDRRYCVVCFALADTRVREIPASLRALFHRPEFRTKRRRMGTVIRVADARVSYYTFNDRAIHVLT